MNFTQDFFDSIESGGWKTKIAIQDDKISLTYQQLHNLILCRAQWLEKSGFRSGDKVIFMQPDSCKWIVDFFATFYLGGSAVLLPYNCLLSRLEYTVDLTGAKWICCNTSHKKTLPENLTIIGNTETKVITTPPADIDPDQSSLWLWSSGTSGRYPKCVLHKHNSLINSIDILKDSYGTTAGKVVFSTSKLSFQYGLFNALYGLFCGYCVVVTEKIPSPKVIKKIVLANKVTHFFSTPTVLNSLSRFYQDTDTLSSVEALISAGEHLSDSLEQKLQSIYKKPILNAIGMSEMIVCMSGNTPNDHMAGTLGKPWKNIEIMVVNDLDQEVEINEIGEMLIKSPTCAIGYHNDHDASAKVFQGEWYRSNDLVRRLENNRIKFVGRKNDCNKINGLFVSPLEVENVILLYQSVKECMVAIVNNKHNQKILVANLVLGDSSQEFLPGNLRQFLSNYLEPHMIPKVIKIVDEIPTTFNTKKIRSKIIIDSKDLDFI